MDKTELIYMEDRHGGMGNVGVEVFGEAVTEDHTKMLHFGQDHQRITIIMALFGFEETMLLIADSHQPLLAQNLSLSNLPAPGSHQQTAMLSIQFGMGDGEMGQVAVQHSQPLLPM